MSCTEKISLMTYNAEKNLTPLYVGENISNSREVWEKILPQTKSVKSPLPHSPTNVQWSCQPFRGWGKKRIWHLSKCHPSTKWLARVHHVVVFKTKGLHFKIENTLGLFRTNQGSEVSEDTWGTFPTLWSKESTILKRNFCIYKGFMDVFYILTSAWKKNHKMCIWNWFLPCARPIYANCF